MTRKTKTAQRARPGDILEVRTAGGLAYLQYVGRRYDYGEAILVSPTIYKERPSDLSGAFENAYVTFYPVNAAVAQKLVEVVGRSDVPPGLPPTRLRRAGMRSDRGVETWVIENGTGQVVRNALSDDERHLPIGEIWNHEFLLDRLARGWRPEMEGH